MTKPVILIIEQNSSIREMLRQMAERMNEVDVTTRETPPTASEMLDGSNPADLVIVGETEVFTHTRAWVANIRMLREELQMVACTGCAESDVELMKAGCWKHLMRPVAMMTLHETIGEGLRLST